MQSWAHVTSPEDGSPREAPCVALTRARRTGARSERAVLRRSKGETSPGPRPTEALGSRHSWPGAGTTCPVWSAGLPWSPSKVGGQAGCTGAPGVSDPDPVVGALGGGCFCLEERACGVSWDTSGRCSGAGVKLRLRAGQVGEGALQVVLRNPNEGPWGFPVFMPRGSAFGFTTGSSSFPGLQAEPSGTRWDSGAGGHGGGGALLWAPRVGDEVGAVRQCPGGGPSSHPVTVISAGLQACQPPASGCL